MSLKAFHILFIAVSILLSVAVGAWGIERFLRQGSLGGLGLGLVFFLVGLALVIYGARFFGKLRKLGD